MIQNNKKNNLPIIFLSISILFTLMPVLYTYFPLLGKVKIVLICGIGLLISFALSSQNYTNYYAWRNPIFIAWAGFLSTMIMSLVVSYDRGVTLEFIISVSKYILIFGIMIKIIDTEVRLDKIMRLLSFCGVGMAMSTTFNTLVFGRGFEGSIRGMGVVSGIFADPNDLALLFNATLPILIYFFYQAKNKIIPFLAICGVVLGVILTYSRGGFLGLCAVLLGIVLLMKEKRNRIIVIIIVGAILFITFAPEEYIGRISTILIESQVDTKTGEYPGRLQAWIELLPVGIKSPIIGHGAGSSYYLAGTLRNDWVLVHNSFLQVYLETGLLGFGFYLGMYLAPFMQYRRLKYDLNKIGAYGHIERYKFIIISIIAFSVTAFFLPQAYSPIVILLSGLAIVQYELAIRSIRLREANNS